MFHNIFYSHYSVNACLAPVCSMHGLAVTTVEGIGSVKSGLHPVQVCVAVRLDMCSKYQNGLSTYILDRLKFKRSFGVKNKTIK